MLVGSFTGTLRESCHGYGRLWTQPHLAPIMEDNAQMHDSFCYKMIDLDNVQDLNQSEPTGPSTQSVTFGHDEDWLLLSILAK
ncbi:hypothetical protein PC129_g16323 [Phytophthora cactorum]|uniref:Uncharacterized protein n=1 Tax=Phytophthora cactorum TaxID=29920 RepID=A0A8T1HK48_9STRA|nr:hypothetical protein PC114_g11239 [Phytophthora cactorum]KAG2921198.1 hypothetical protein PC115_g9603 [Phytophthora cactorum]KAG3083985.1 hypothetical protein PC122_g10325 [Phytophthora cactorum]KAG3163821.1 hypothetical protein PC128_g20287 [Phytophthora cactorum]KAG3167451.1 hypothetical protein C6341_g11701 [Phytophthora cactorum]